MATTASAYYIQTVNDLKEKKMISDWEIDADDEKSSIVYINSAMESAKREYRRRESESLIAASACVLSE
jgi:hypothetical protein